MPQVGEEGPHHLLVTEDTLETVVCQDIDISASLCAMIVSRLIYAAKLLISFQTCKKSTLKMQKYYADARGVAEVSPHTVFHTL